jgi:hypothetical protein
MDVRPTSRLRCNGHPVGRPAVTGCLGLMEARMIEDGHIDHEQLLRLGKVLLLLVEREDLLVRLPVVYQLTQKSLPIEELNRAS